jgi:hypothetical protein
MAKLAVCTYHKILSWTCSSYLNIPRRVCDKRLNQSTTSNYGFPAPEFHVKVPTVSKV